MVYREHKKAAMHRRLPRLRSIARSRANKTSVMLDASKNIEKLMQNMETLNQNIAAAAAPQNSSTAEDSTLPVVRVEGLEKGFLINVMCERSCTGLLVFLLEAFEELGLDLPHATVSCSENFYLEAVGEYVNEGEAQKKDAQEVKQAVLQAIQNWSNENTDQQERFKN